MATHWFTTINYMRLWRNWNTRSAKDAVPQGLGVQIPSTAPKEVQDWGQHPCKRAISVTVSTELLLYALVLQLVEGIGLEPIKCGSESHRGYHPLFIVSFSLPAMNIFNIIYWVNKIIKVNNIRPVYFLYGAMV